MLSPNFFSTFAEQRPRVIRLALRLMRDYDLLKFRILRIQTMRKQYGTYKAGVNPNGFSVVAFNTLIRIGFLERGPVARFKGIRPGFATYRIHPSFLLSAADLKTYFSEQRETAERMKLEPEVVLYKRRKFWY